MVPSNKMAPLVTAVPAAIADNSAMLLPVPIIAAYDTPAAAAWARDCRSLDPVGALISRLLALFIAVVYRR